MEEISTQTAEEILIEQASDDQDFSNFTKSDFEELVKKMSKSNFTEQFSVFKKAKPFIDDLLENEKNNALEKFLAEGGIVDDFEYHGVGFYEQFEKHFIAAKKHAAQEFKDNLQKKETNYTSKLAIIQQIKDLIEKASTGKGGFEKFKSLQEEWKATGPVAHDKAQELWSNYHAVVNRFYDQRHIAFEILDLDRKHNLQGKLLLCTKVEKLASETNIKKALRELDMYQEEFKHIGPVPKEKQDEIWNRFKEAIDKIYANKNQFLESEKTKQEESLTKKTALLEKLQILTQFQSDKIADWTEKTKEVEAFQAEWKKSGLIHKDKVKEINTIYWDGLKLFFNNKRNFFQKLDTEKKNNLTAKTAITEKIESLLVSENMDEAIKSVLELQKEWKLIGQVPLKQKDKSYEKFKQACDAIFDKKRGVIKQNQEVAKQQLKEKFDVVETTKNLSFESIEDIKTAIANWHAVPESSGAEYAKLYHIFAETIKNKLSKLAQVPDIEKDKLIMPLQIAATKLSTDGQKDLAAWERKLRKEVNESEDVIAQINNNLAFFARAKNADTIKKEFDFKVIEETKKMNALKLKLKMLTDLLKS